MKSIYCDTNVSFTFHFLGSVGVVVHIKWFKEFILWLSIDVAICNTMGWSIFYFAVYFVGVEFTLGTYKLKSWIIIVSRVTRLWAGWSMV
jgi:hypothetical protein